VAWPGTDARAQSRSPLTAGILACLLDHEILGFSPARARTWARHLPVVPAQHQACGRA